MARKHLPLLCPSSRIERPGAKLLGVLNAEGKVQFLDEPRPVTPEFAEIALRGRDPHLRFRFSGPCSQSACPSWEKGGCAVPDVVEALERDPGALPSCPVRASCRWHAERGDDVCRVCPQIIHSLFVEELEAVDALESRIEVLDRDGDDPVLVE